MPPPFLLLLLLASSLIAPSLPLTSSLSSSSSTTRRILHQPFFPQPTNPPPKYPFTPSSFFPSYTPPPPSPTPFPTTISPINLSHHSKSPSTKLIASAVLAALAVVSIVLFLNLRDRNNNKNRHSLSQSKTQRSHSTISSSTRPPSNDRHTPKLSRPSQTSSEFLYLGTLHAAATATADDNTNASVNPTKLDSPELRPLPPLNTAMQQKLGHTVRANTTADTISSRDDESEEFYSPKGSITGRESSIGAGSASRIAFAAVEVHNFNNSTSSSSSSYSSSVPGSESGSPVRSASLSLSPANSLSSRASFMPKSPDLIEIQPVAPLPRQIPVSREPASPSPPVSSSPEIFSRWRIETSPRLSNASSDQCSESPVRIASPMKHDNDAGALSSLSHSGGSEQSSPRISNFSDQNFESQAKISNPARHVSNAIPPPPPPPPPPRVSIPPPPPLPPPPPQPISRASERLRTPTAKSTVPEPPALATALRSIAFDSPPPISPMELPSTNDGSEESPNKETEHSSEAVDVNDESTTPKPKLKPLHWDKVRASSDREMVWDQLKCSSFKLNEEMIETLFVVNTQKPSPKEASRWQVLPSPGLDNRNRVLDPKKAQNIAILLRALNVTVEEVCEGLLEGNADILGTELLESLLKMAPSKEEEWKLKGYKDDSPVKLGAAERFLKAVVDIPHAFKRVDAMLYVSNFESEVEYLKKSFATLEAACEELRTSRMFLKLLEAVLKTGNRMNVGTNRGEAHAFKLDTLLKLIDVKGADGKTTLLHFVVQEIIRSEGARLSGGCPSANPSINDDAKCRKLGLQVVSALCSELSSVKKAAVMDAEVLSSDVSKISIGIANIGEVIRINEEIKVSGSHKFCENMNNFVKRAKEEIIRVQAQESVSISLVKEVTEYFHGNSAREEAHPFRIFVVVRDFLAVLDRVCKEVGTINERTIVSSAHKFPVPVNPMLQQGCHRRQYTSSDEEEKNVNS